jgi:uncharacterized protein DUF4013
MATPAAPPPNIDFGRCFRFVVEDADWVKKLLIGGVFTLLSALIVGTFFVAGYWVRFLRRVVAGEPRPLPEWDDLGGIFGDGLKVVGAYFVFVAGVLALVLLLGCGVGIVVVGIGGLSDLSESARAMAAALGGIGLVGVYALLALLGLAGALFLPAVFVRVALKDRFEEAFAFREALAFIQANVGNYLLSLVFYLVANFASQFGALLCCVGIFPAVFWSYLVLGYSLGETVRLNPRSL